jgi:Trp operon repressor
MLAQGFTQRDIAKELQVSLCKVTRGAKILRNKDSVFSQYLIKEKNNAYN